MWTPPILPGVVDAPVVVLSVTAQAPQAESVVTLGADVLVTELTQVPARPSPTESVDEEVVQVEEGETERSGASLVTETVGPPLFALTLVTEGDRGPGPGLSVGGHGLLSQKALTTKPL